MLNLTAPAGILVKTTLVDYPGRIASAFFFAGCNLRCPYCYNTGLAVPPYEQSLCTVSDLFAHLQKRKTVIHALVLSGGEALLRPDLGEIILNAKKLGYKIKLDTNGTLPHLLAPLAADSSTRPDFIAMDLKTSPEKCNLLCDSLTPAEYEEKIRGTISILKEYFPTAYEIRTVLVPALVSKENIEKLSEFVPEKASWNFAQFLNERCLNESFCKINPYTEQQINEIIETARQRVPNAALR